MTRKKLSSTKNEKLVNRIIIALLLFCFSNSQLFAANTYAETTRLTLRMEQVKLKEVLMQIENQSEFYFVYNSSLIDVERTVNVNIKNRAIKDVLAQLFDNKDIVIKVVDRQIVLAPSSLQENHATVPVPNNQNITITGIVTDFQGEPLPGVNVMVKGTSIGVITDIDGKYAVNVPNRDAVLVFSYIGFIAREIPANDQNISAVTLFEDAQRLDEVVVVGYGTQKKVNLTGAVSQITAKELKDRPLTNMTKGLQGVIPNLNIVFGSGKPGESGTLNIRGTTSINGGGPLVLVDGVPGDMDRINVSDVESVTVLKDASASAIYGARAAFGVILITTKNPTAGKTQINYQNNFGWTTHATNTDFITTGYWNLKLNDEAAYTANGNTASRYTDEDMAELWARVNDKIEHPDRPWVVIKQNASGQNMYRYYGNFDWFNYAFTKYRPKQSHDVSISGANDKIRYLISGRFSDEKGIFKIRPDVNRRRYNLSGSTGICSV